MVVSGFGCYPYNSSSRIKSLSWLRAEFGSMSVMFGDLGEALLLISSMVLLSGLSRFSFTSSVIGCVFLHSEWQYVSLGTKRSS